MANLNLTLLGAFQARLGTGPPLQINGKKAKALLALLAIPLGQQNTREKLASLLWGDTPDDHAANNLRQTLFTIRKVVGDSAALVEQGRALALAATVDVDVATFDRLVAEGSPAALRRAAALYHGDLLEGLDVNEPPFEDWLRTQRERLREQALEAMVRLLAHELSIGDLTHAARTANKVLTIDPLQEAVHRTLMRIYVRQGRRPAALRQYELCVTQLQRELGTEPDAETKQSYREILQGHPLDPPEPAHTAGVAEAPLIGRKNELDWFDRAFLQASQSTGRVVALMGEAGVGKTSILSAVAGAARDRGAQLLIGRAYLTEQVLAFGPWLDALRSSHVAADVEVVNSLAPVWRDEFSRLLPELGTSAAAQSSPTGDPLRLFESVRQWLMMLANRGPVAVMLEDLHWADETSIRLLAFLARRIQNISVLLVFTVREEEVPASSLLKQFLDELNREANADTMRLLPLQRNDIAKLIRAMTRTGSDEATLSRLEERIWTLSQGNPFVAVEAMRAVNQSETADTLDALPPRVREVIAARLDQLGPSARQLLAIAAVIARACDFAVLRRAAHLSEEETADAVEELVRKRVLCDIGEGFSILHDRIREVACAQLMPARVRLLHLRIAEAIETVHVNRLEKVCDRLAHHYAEAENAPKAVEYLARTAERAVQTYAYEDGVNTFKRALAFVSQLPPSERDVRAAHLVLRLAHSLYFLGRYRESIDLLLDYQDHIERLQDSTIAAAYHFLIGRYYSLLGDLRATSHAERAIEEAIRCGDAATIGRAKFVLASECLWLARYRDGVRYAGDAVRLLQDANELWWAGSASWMLGMIQSFSGDFEFGLEAQALTEDIGRRTADDHLVISAMIVRAWIHAMRGDCAAGLALSRDVVERSRDHFNRSRAMVVVGYSLLQQGAAADAVSTLEFVVDMLAGAGIKRLECLAMAFLSDAYLLHDNFDRARTVALNCVELASVLKTPIAGAAAHRTLGRLALRLDSLSDARRELTDALDAFDRLDAVFESARTRIDLAELAGRCGDPGSVATHLSDAKRIFEKSNAPLFVARVDALLKTRH